MIGFAALAAFLLYRLGQHAMWRDELQAWMIARASPDLLSLLHNLRYEGHPPLWYLMLWPLARVTGDPLVMQALTAVLGLVTLFALWFAAPFSTLEKGLLGTNYFIGFEYAQISRSYALALTLVFVFLALARHLERRPWLGWTLLGLLANTQFFFTLVALALAGAWLGTSARRRVHRAPLGCFAVLAGLAMLTMIWSEVSTPGGWSGHAQLSRLQDSLAVVPMAFIPGTAGDWRYWHMDLAPGWRYVMALVSFAIACAYLRKQRLMLIMFFLLSAAITGFFHLRYGGFVWHAGAIFVTFVAITAFCRARSLALGPKVLFLALLAPGTIGGVNAMLKSVHQPLSMARDTARWIEEHGLQDQFWMARDHAPASAVAGYLGKPMYYFECRCLGTFVEWPIRYPDMPLERAVSSALREHGLDEGYLLTNVAPQQRGAGVRIQALASFTGAEVANEQFYLSRVRVTEAHGSGPP